jgi:hypothetical protein
VETVAKDSNRLFRMCHIFVSLETIENNVHIDTRYKVKVSL